MISGLSAGGLINAVIFYILFGGVWYFVIFHRAYFSFAHSEKLKTQHWIFLLLRILGVHLVVGAIISVVLAMMVRFMLAITFLEGMECGFWLWLGFVMTLGLKQVLMEKYPLKRFLIHCGHALIAMAVMGGILTIWQY